MYCSKFSRLFEQNALLSFLSSSVFNAARPPSMFSHSLEFSCSKPNSPQSLLWNVSGLFYQKFLLAIFDDCRFFNELSQKQFLLEHLNFLFNFPNPWTTFLQSVFLIIQRQTAKPQNIRPESSFTMYSWKKRFFHHFYILNFLLISIYPLIKLTKISKTPQNLPLESFPGFAYPVDLQVLITMGLILFFKWKRSITPEHFFSDFFFYCKLANNFLLLLTTPFFCSVQIWYLTACICSFLFKFLNGDSFPEKPLWELRLKMIKCRLLDLVPNPEIQWAVKGNWDFQWEGLPCAFESGDRPERSKQKEKKQLDLQ